jgi:glyoxylase-like metal-dependent hydrolase (beta-lactamase superfamily II)
MPASLEFPFAAPPPPGETIEVAPGIAWLRMALPFALDHINLWLVGTRALSIVDTGYGDAPTRELWERHLSRIAGRRTVERLVATHYHPDHLGNGAWLADRLRLSVTITATEYLTAHAVHAQAAGFALEDSARLFRAHGVAEDHVVEFLARGNHYRRGVPELPRHYLRLYPGDSVLLGGRAFRVIAGYGHSPEHAALYDAVGRVLISGDMLLPRISTNVSVWPADPDGDPLGRFLASLTAFEKLPEDTLVLPSHGLPFRGIAARVAALRAHHEARLAELVHALEHAAGPSSAADVVPVLFRRELDTQQRFFAVGEAIAHLNHLWASGQATRRIEAGGAVRFAPARGVQGRA